MADEIKILRGSRINQPSPQEGPGLITRLGVSALQGLEAPGRLLDFLSTSLGGPTFTKGSLAQDIAGKLGVTNQEQLQPQGFLESIGQKFLSQAPIAALFGPGVVARSAVGSIPAGILQQLGASPLLQDVSQIATETGLGLIPKSALRRAPALQPLVGEIPTLTKATQTAQKALEEIPVKPYIASQITDVTKAVTKGLKTETRGPIVEKVKHALEVIKDNISGKEINPHNAAKLRKSLYRLKETMPEKDYIEYIDPLTKGINKFFTAYAAENPEFYSKLSARDRLTELKNMKTTIDGVIDLISPTAFGGLGKIYQKLMKGIFGSTIGETERVLRGIVGNPEARKYYFNATKAAIKNDPTVLVRNLQDLSLNLIDTLKSKEPEASEKKESQIKIYRGKKL